MLIFLEKIIFIAPIDIKIVGVPFLFFKFMSLHLAS